MDYQTAISLVLSNEGGLVDNPADPGGLTNWGISFNANPQLTADQIRAMTRDQAAEFYRVNFWVKIDGDGLAAIGLGSVAFQILDFAVNGGNGTAVHKVQQALGLADDGHWGPVTEAAVKATSVSKFTALFAAVKISFYTKLSTFPQFGAGWMNRIAADIEAVAGDL